ncbi:hypothetical protein ACN38_g12549 [Penicillium nordicum]|uniref:Uncharacterized protein n=1 Tax=Penicillium nordicum TaxID=229535 RepID=A0A0M9W9R4_9EURO|nr:hypothetical protein ACN38_g12549 [Penicillium nordicum]
MLQKVEVQRRLSNRARKSERSQAPGSVEAPPERIHFQTQARYLVRWRNLQKKKKKKKWNKTKKKRKKKKRNIQTQNT